MLCILFDDQLPCIISATCIKGYQFCLHFTSLFVRHVITDFSKLKVTIGVGIVQTFTKIGQCEY